jgi:hypothetical protein
MVPQHNFSLTFLPISILEARYNGKHDCWWGVARFPVLREPGSHDRERFPVPQHNFFITFLSISIFEARYSSKHDCRWDAARFPVLQEQGSHESEQFPWREWCHNIISLLHSFSFQILKHDTAVNIIGGGVQLSCSCYFCYKHKAIATNTMCIL